MYGDSDQVGRTGISRIRPIRSWVRAVVGVFQAGGVNGSCSTCPRQPGDTAETNRDVTAFHDGTLEIRNGTLLGQEPGINRRFH